MKHRKKRKIKMLKLLKRRTNKFLKKVRNKSTTYYEISNENLFEVLIKNSFIYKHLNKCKFYKKPNIQNGKAIIEIPKIFSFSKNPFNTIDVFKELFFSFENKLSIFINHENCEEIDLAASLVMDIIVMEFRNICKRIGLKREFGGKLSRNENVNDVLKFSGVLNNLGIIKSKKNSRLELLPLIKNQDPGIMSTKIIEYYNNCLESKGFILNAEGANHFSTMLGEVIKNCSDHGGKGVQWYASGHYTKDDGEFNLAIFDFGNTIYEGLKNETLSKDTIKTLNELTAYHKEGFKRVDEELLWTLFSLQHGISRLNSEEDNTRGQGTVDLICGFQQLGGKYADNGNLEKPIMSITSGNINILFDGTYTIKSDKNGLKVIAFNNENDIKSAPDEKYVKNIKKFFPGTVISIRFFIDRKYIEEIKNND